MYGKAGKGWASAGYGKGAWEDWGAFDGGYDDMWKGGKGWSGDFGKGKDWGKSSPYGKSKAKGGGKFKMSGPSRDAWSCGFEEPVGCRGAYKGEAYKGEAKGSKGASAKASLKRKLEPWQFEKPIEAELIGEPDENGEQEEVLRIPAGLSGWLIGKGGEAKRALEERTGCKFEVGQIDEVTWLCPVHLFGTEEKREAVRKHVEEKWALEKSLVNDTEEERREKQKALWKEMKEQYKKEKQEKAAQAGTEEPEDAVYAAVLKALDKAGQLTEDEKHVKKLIKYTRSAAKQLNYVKKGLTWQELVDECAVNLFALLQNAMSDEEWVQDLDFVDCLAASMREVVPSSFIEHVSDDELKEALKIATAEAADEQQFLPKMWEAVKEVFPKGKPLQNKLFSSVEAGRKEAVATLRAMGEISTASPDAAAGAIDGFLVAWIEASMKQLLPAKVPGPMVAQQLQEGTAATFFVDLVENRGGLPKPLQQAASSYPGGGGKWLPLITTSLRDAYAPYDQKLQQRTHGVAQSWDSAGWGAQAFQSW
eukprot:TRINITY_DN46460_c0_g1_i1.p1 TRINITY_DN46460_c0_g1~~TRINITY_DN46460_c0_g1_i1.p1  ORF type:complete len:535 (-),score=144.95 TRINITY_DN46460_c0_g1_i1:196-1800(-)